MAMSAPVRFVYYGHAWVTWLGWRGDGVGSKEICKKKGGHRGSNGGRWSMGSTANCALGRM